MLTHAALPEERQQYIRDLLARTGRALAIDLSIKFNVSEHTIRRDLADLVKAGVCKRVYGGAITLAPNGGTLHKRVVQQSERKRPVPPPGLLGRHISRRHSQGKRRFGRCERWGASPGVNRPMPRAWRETRRALQSIELPRHETGD